MATQDFSVLLASFNDQDYPIKVRDTVAETTASTRTIFLTTSVDLARTVTGTSHVCETGPLAKL